MSGPDHERGQLGFWMSTALVVGNTIGMGIFVLPASLAPYGFNALIGWAVTGIGCVVLAWVFARLAQLMPEADGPYGYIRRTLGQTPGFLAIWGYWVSFWISNAALAIGVVGYLRALLPPLASAPPALLAIALVWSFVVINLFGVRTGGRVQVLTTTLKLMPMAAVMGLGLWLLFTEPAAYANSLPTTPISPSGIMTASTLALYAMLGLESATVPASRVRHPGRTIPRATIAGTVLTAVITMAVSTVPMLLIPQRELAQSQAPFVALFERYVSRGNGRWLAVFVVISGLGALNGWTLLAGELTRTMAANGLMPARFARVNRRGAPALALVVVGLLASAVSLMNYSKSLVAGFTLLTTLVTAVNLPLYLLCSLALIALWRSVRPMPRDLPWFGVLGASYAAFAFVGVGHEPLLWVLALAAAGLPLYALMRLRGSGAAPNK